MKNLYINYQRTLKDENNINKYINSKISYYLQTSAHSSSVVANI